MALARAVERQMSKFKPQNVANTAWAFATLKQTDGKLFISTMKGELVLVTATPKGFTEVSRATVLSQPTRQAPVIANGRLYLRDDSEIVCLKVGR